MTEPDPIDMTGTWVRRDGRVPPTGRNEFCCIDPGLFFWVTPNGTRTWMSIYRVPGVDGDDRTVKRKEALGRWPAMGIAAARDAARETMALAQQGIDPEAKKTAARE